MNDCVLSVDADFDLDDIREFIAADSMSTPPGRWIEKPFAEFEALGRTPGMGHRREDLTSHPVLFLPVGARPNVGPSRSRRDAGLARYPRIPEVSNQPLSNRMREAVAPCCSGGKFRDERPSVIIDSRTDTRYGILTLKTFRRRGLKRLFETDDAGGVRADQVRRIRDVLAHLDQARRPSDVSLPGYRLHPLRGDLKGYWSVTVSGNWRIIFRFENGDAFDVDFVDYH